MSRGVTTGSRTKAATQPPMKTTVFQVNGANMSPRAMTVPRSVTKQAPRMPLPNSVLLKPVSSMTA